MNKYLLLSLFVLLLIPVVYAAGITTVSLTKPINNTWDTDGTINFTFNVTGNSSEYNCTLWHNIAQAFGETSQANSTVANHTASFFIKTDVANNHTGYLWNIGCNIASNATYVFASTNSTLKVDTISPVIVVNYPGPNNWTNNSNIQFNITVTELNNESCVLETNLNVTTNTTGAWNTSAGTVNYKNGTKFNFTFGFVNPVSAWLDNNTGAYLWNALCNDSAGNTARFSNGNATFFVDTIMPTKPNVTFPLNNTFTTDFTPSLRFINTTELNFSRYLVQIDDNTDFSSPEFESNITNQSANFSQITPNNLTGDKTYFIRVTAYDQAGNHNVSIVDIVYNTDATCAKLIADSWNVCAIVRNTTVNASDLCTETNCTFIAQYNRTHQFQTFTSGSATNGAMSFSGGNIPNTTSVVFVYVSSTNKSWENITWSADAKYLYFNLTNESTGWNIVPIMNRSVNFTLWQLDKSLNAQGNITGYKSNHSRFISVYNALNASGFKYTPYVANKSINNATIAQYGSAVWIHLNKSIASFIWNATNEI